MSERVFASLAPFWIGIVANILFSIFHLKAIGHDNKFLRWYFLKGGVNFIFFGMWIVLIAWSVINWFTYSAK